MTRVLKQQESLDLVSFEKEGNGWLFVAMGIIVSFFLWPIGLVIGVLFAFMGLKYVNEGNRFHAGAVGEKLVSDSFNRYPDDWYIFNDMVIGSSQIDHIVICPKGVYTIETKNYQGTIRGNVEETGWIQIIGKGYERPFYNPVLQGKKHSSELRKYFEKCGFKVWVGTIVVFADQDSKLEVASRDVPVIYLDKLNGFFDRQRNVMDQDLCEGIVECISDLLQNSG